MYDEAVRDYELANKMDRGNQEVRQLLQQAKLEVKKAKRKDYYKILGVSKDANDDEIKKAYRKRALVHHPGNHLSLHINVCICFDVLMYYKYCYEPLVDDIQVHTICSFLRSPFVSIGRRKERRRKEIQGNW